MNLNLNAQNRLVKAARGIGDGFYNTKGALGELESVPGEAYGLGAHREIKSPTRHREMVSGGLLVTLHPDNKIEAEPRALKY